MVRKDRVPDEKDIPVKIVAGLSAWLFVLKLITRLYLKELRLRLTGHKDTHAHTEEI